MSDDPSNKSLKTARSPLGDAHSEGEVYHQTATGPARSSRKRVVLLTALIAAAAPATFIFINEPAATAKTTAVPLPTVVVATPLEREVDEWDSLVGRFAPSRSVEVRPRVAGQIASVNFTDGEVVKEGQLLFTIDERPFAAALAEAQAGLASAKSDLALARAEVGRADRLVGNGAVSKSEFDRFNAKVQGAEAMVAVGEARVRLRELELEFTRVRAPIAGRVSSRRTDPGNIVTAGEGANSTLLTTINALDPIYFTFDASEALYLKIRRARDSGERATRVDVRLQDEAAYGWQGQLDFTDNGLNPRAGTIRMRATIANPDLFLTPGMFGNMRLASGVQAAALLIPDAAVQTDQTRKTVLVVDEKGLVALKAIQVGPVIDGLRIVRSGISVNDRVVIGGIQSANPGSKVDIKEGVIAPASKLEPRLFQPTRGEATFAP